MAHILLASLALPLLQTVGGEWGTHHTVPPHAQQGQNTGLRLAVAGDFDADGVPDSFASCLSGSGDRAVRWISGATGESPFVVTGAANRHLFGDAILTHPDWDGDGVADLVVGAPLDDRLLWDGGSVTVYSGADATELTRIEIGVIDGHFGSSLALFDDVDGDGRAELLVGAVEVSAAGPNEHGAVYLIASATGQPLRRFDGELPYEQCGSSVLATGDLDGDGFGDLVAGAWYSGSSVRLTYFSGATGAVLRRHSASSTTYSTTPWTLADAGDVDGDGVRDQLAGQACTDAFGALQIGSVALLSGATGRVVWERSGRYAHDRFGTLLVVPGDLDGDGLVEAVAGTGLRLEVLDLATGTLEGTEFSPAVASLVAGGDLDADGHPDWLAGRPSAAAGEGEIVLGGFKAGLHVDGAAISAAAGASLALELDFADADSGRMFQLLASASGTGPVVLDGVEIPLGMDRLLRYTARRPPNGPFWPPIGILDPRGDGTAVLHVASGVASPLVGRTLHLAVVVFHLQLGTVQASSVARPLLVQP